MLDVWECNMRKIQRYCVKIRMLNQMDFPISLYKIHPISRLMVRKGLPRTLLNQRLLLCLGLIAVVACTMFILLSQNVEAERDIVVDKEGNGDYTNLNQALVNSIPGDRIHLRAGNYSIERLDFPSNNVTLEGEGAENTNISFELTGQYIFTGKSNITISSLSMRYKYIEYLRNQSYPHYKQIEFNNCSDITIANCSILGVEFHFSTPLTNIIIRDNAFNNSRIEANWLSIFLPKFEGLTLTNNTMDEKPLRFMKGEKDLVITEDSGGFILSGCTNITFMGSNLSRWTNGLFIFHSTIIRIVDCYFNSTANGFGLWNSTDIQIINTTILGKENELNPVFFSNITHLLLTDNTMRVSPWLYQCPESILENNVFLSSASLWIASSEATVRNNTFETGGVLIWPRFILDPLWNLSNWLDVDYEFTNNTVGGKPLLYYHSDTDIIIPDNAGQVIILNSSQITISNIEFNGTTFPVTIMGSDTITIKNSKFESNYIPIQLYFSNNLTIDNCEFDNSASEVSLSGTNHSVVMNSVFNNSGVSMLGFGNVIDNCNFQGLWSGSIGSGKGLDVQGSIDISNVSISGYFQGVQVWDANVTITNSSITANTYGIDYYGGNVSIHYCVIADNDRHGIGSGQPNREFVEGEIDARYNYWGDPSGPHNIQYNNNWAGDVVEDNVTFYPWFEDEELTTLTTVEWDENDEEDEPDDKAKYLGLLFLFLVIIFLVVLLSRLADLRSSGSRVNPHSPPPPPREERSRVPLVKTDLKSPDTSPSASHKSPIIESSNEISEHEPFETAPDEYYERIHKLKEKD